MIIIGIDPGTATSMGLPKTNRVFNSAMRHSVVSVVLCCLCCLIAGSASAQTRLHFQKVAGGIGVDVKLNSRLNVRLLVDTGSFATILLPSIAKTLALSTEEYSTPNIPNAKRTVLSSVQIGELILEKSTVLVASLPDLQSWNKDHPKERLDGFLGMNTLKHLAIGVDFVSETMSFWKTGKLLPQAIQSWFDLFPMATSTTEFALLGPGAELPAPTAWQLQNNPAAIQVENKIYSPLEHAEHYTKIGLSSAINSDLSLVDCRIDERAARLLVDTGATDIALHEKFMQRTRRLRPFSNSEVDTIRMTLAVKVCFLSSIKLGDFSVQFPKVCVVPTPADVDEEEALGVEGILGLNFFGSDTGACQVLFDFPSRVMYLARATTQDAQNKLFLTNLGIDFEGTVDKLTLLVVETSLAAKAGLLNGDQLLAVDTIDVAHVTEQTAALFSKWRPSTKVQLTVKRKGAKAPLVFHLSNMTASPVQ